MSNVLTRKIAVAQQCIAGFLSLIIGRKVSVQWGHSASCAPDGTIMLPRPKTGDADEISLLTRRAVHEAGHLMHTDFSGVPSLDENVKTVLNTLEDPRIEALQTQAYQGASLILNRGLESMLKVLSEQLDPSLPEHHATLVSANILLRGYLRMTPHQAIVEHGAELLNKGDFVLGARGVDAVKTAVDQLPLCRNTGDTIQLARNLWAALQPPEETPSSSSDEESQANGQDEPKDQESPAAPSSNQPNPDGDNSQEGEGSGGAGTSDNPAAAGNAEKGDEPASDAGAVGNADSQNGPSDSDASGTPAGESQANDGHAAGPHAGEAGEKGDRADQGSDASAAQQPDAGGQGGSAGNHGAGGLKLSAAAGMDMGGLLSQAYQALYGDPDVDAESAGLAAETTDSSDQVVNLLAQAMSKAEANGETVEQALGIVYQQIAAEAEESADGDEESALAILAGSANGNGEAFELNHEIRFSGVISQLVRVFLRQLQDTRRRPMKYAPAGGQIASNRIWRMKRLGETNVFRVRKPMAGIDASVTILLDRSASMSADIVQAAETVLACSQALERISKVKASIEMFPGPEGWQGSTKTLQLFGQSARQVAARCSELDAGGGTPLAEALREAVPRLLAQRTQKHVLILVTDGEPNNRDEALKELAWTEAQGVEIMGIGMGEHCRIEQLLPYSIHINAAAQLPAALEKLFKSHLVLKLAA